MARELTELELELEAATELPHRSLMHRFRHHHHHHHHHHHDWNGDNGDNGNGGNDFSQSQDNSIFNHTEQATTIAGNDNSVDQGQGVANIIFSNQAGTQQN